MLLLPWAVLNEPEWLLLLCYASLPFSQRSRHWYRHRTSAHPAPYTRHVPYPHCTCQALHNRPLPPSPSPPHPLTNNLSPPPSPLTLSPDPLSCSPALSPSKARQGRHRRPPRRPPRRQEHDQAHAVGRRVRRRVQRLHPIHPQEADSAPSAWRGGRF